MDPAEALELRRAGITAPVLALIAIGEPAAAIEAGVDVTAGSAAFVATIAAAAGRAGKPARLHLEADTGLRPTWAVEAFEDLEEDVRQSRARITASPFVPHKHAIRGFVFDLATGKLNEVS